MKATKSTTISIDLDAAEQFVTTEPYSDKKIHITSLTARWDGEKLARIDATGFAVLGQTGKPGRRVMKTHWLAHPRPSDELILVAPGSVLGVVSRAAHIVDFDPSAGRDHHVDF